MEINREEKTYEGIPAISGMMMSLFEFTGIREHIDSIFNDNSNRILSTGMAVKAMIGTMYDRGKYPLYRVQDYYSTAPTDLLFGENVEKQSISDTTLASRLDMLSSKNLTDLIYNSYDLICKTFDFGSNFVRFMDASNYTMYGLNYVVRQTEFNEILSENGIELEDVPLPAYGGNAKNGRNHLVQMNIHTITDKNGILMYSRSYSGNSSDQAMNRDAIRYLIDKDDAKDIVLCADCKMCVSDVLISMVKSNMFFITKVPLIFNELLHDRMVYSTKDAMLETRPGRHVFDTTEIVDDVELRVIAYALASSRIKSENYIKGNGLKTKTKAMTSLKRKKFFCEKDAMEAFNQTLTKGVVDAYTATPVVYLDELLVKNNPNGPCYRVKTVDLSIDNKKLDWAIDRHCMQILITNLPFSDKTTDDIRTGATTDEVIETYLEQSKAEANFKIMKSGMGIGNVYIHTPSRISAIAAVVSLATMMQNVADAIFKRTKEKGETRMTVKSLSDKLMRSLIWYNRRKDSLTVTGGKGDTEFFFKYFDRLGVNPQLLLGHL